MARVSETDDECGRLGIAIKDGSLAAMIGGMFRPWCDVMPK
jgi:hypothetical protein